MKKRRRNKLNLGRAVRGGIRTGILILTTIATVKIAAAGWARLETRLGNPGGELLIAPLFLLLFYAGWTARKEYTDYRVAARREGR